MAKGQKRSNKEIRKPKADKKPAQNTATSSIASGIQSAKIAANKGPVKKNRGW